MADETRLQITTSSSSHDPEPTSSIAPTAPIAQSEGPVMEFSDPLISAAAISERQNSVDIRYVVQLLLLFLMTNVSADVSSLAGNTAGSVSWVTRTRSWEKSQCVHWDYLMHPVVSGLSRASVRAVRSGSIRTVCSGGSTRSKSQTRHWPSHVPSVRRSTYWSFPKRALLSL
jgi:hypothetical protein